MEMDEKSLESLRRMEPREAYQSVRRAVWQNPWGASSEDMQAALEEMVEAGVLTWDQIDQFEES